MYVFRIIYQYFEENYFSVSLNTRYDNLPYTKTATTLLMLVGGICLGILLASFVVVFEKRVVGKFIRGLLKGGATDKEHAMSLDDLGLSKNGFIKRELSRAGVSRKLVSVVSADGEVISYEDALAAAFPELARSPQKSADEGVEAGAAAENTDGAEPPLEEVAEQEKKSRFVGAKEKMGRFFFGKKFKLKALDFSTARFFIPEALTYRAELRFREKGSSPWLLLLSFVLVLVLFFLSLRFIPVFVEMLDSTIGNLRGL